MSRRWLLGKVARLRLGARDFRRFEGQAQNAGLVTVTAGGTSIVTLNCGTVVAGDRILVTGVAVMTKGATGGQSRILVFKNSGTATIVVGVDDLAIYDDDFGVIASAAPRFHVCGVFRVTVGGTLTLELGGLSIGSDSTVSAGNGELYAWVIPGS